MKVLIVCDVLGEPNNGTTVASLHMIENMKRVGHDVRVLCPTGPYDGKEGYYILPKRSFFCLNWVFAKNGVQLGDIDEKVISEAMEGVEHIHIMLPFRVGQYVAKKADKLNIPTSAGFHCQAENVTAHAALQWCDPLNHAIYRRFWRKFYKYIDCIHYPTQFIKHDFEKVVGPTNGYVISNGAKSEFRHIDGIEKEERYKDKFLILSTGRYCNEKHQTVLFKAVRKSKYKDKIQLILAGDGPLRFEYEKLGKLLPNRPVLGMHRPEELVKIANECDLYVHSAAVDLESIACIEALSTGLVPVIDSSKRAAPRFFALTPNNLYKHNSSKELAEKIDYWIEHPEEKAELSKRYVEYCKRFNFNHCMDRMALMVEEAKAVRVYKTEHHVDGRLVYYDDPKDVRETKGVTYVRQSPESTQFKN